MRVTLAERLVLLEERLSLIEKLLNAESMAKAAPGSDIVWKTGHRPHFWFDAEVRAEVIALYRTMTVDDAVSHCTDKFGARAPSRSAIHRLWKTIDKQRRVA